MSRPSTPLPQSAIVDGSFGISPPQQATHGSPTSTLLPVLDGTITNLSETASPNGTFPLFEQPPSGNEVTGMTADTPQFSLTPEGALEYPVTVDALTLKNHLGKNKTLAVLPVENGEVASNKDMDSKLLSTEAGAPPDSGSNVISEGSKGLQSALSLKKPPTHVANQPVLSFVDQSNNAVTQRMLEAEWCNLAPRRYAGTAAHDKNLSLSARVGLILMSSSWVIFPLLIINILIDVLIVCLFAFGNPETNGAVTITSYELRGQGHLFFVNSGLTFVGFVTYLPCAHFLLGYRSVPSIIIFGLTAYQLALMIMYGYARSYGPYVEEKGYAINGENGPIVVQLIYVPYFIRLWGAQAHVKILTSVLAWRTGLDRLKILRDLFSGIAIFIAAIITSAGLFQLVEFEMSGNEYSLLDTVYWAFVTFTTVGYGDISPKSQVSMLLVIILIFIGLIVVPEFLNVLEYVSRMWPKFNRYSSSGRRHVVVSADITFKELKMLLDEMSFVDKFTDMVFVSSAGFSDKCYNLLRDSRYRTRLTLIEGSIRDRSVLARARAKQANAAILMSAKYSVAMRGDYATLRDSVSLRNFDRNLPQYLWLKYGTHDHLLDGVFCVTHGLRFLRTFLATASVLPGVIPFVVNLIRTQSQSQRLSGREKRGKIRSVCTGVFGGFMPVESSSSDEDKSDDEDILTRQFNTHPRSPTSSEQNQQRTPSRRSSQTTASTLNSEESNLAGLQQQKFKRLHFPVELTSQLATDPDILRRAFSKKYIGDWELLYGIGRFNSLQVVGVPDAYVGKSILVCILHAHLRSRTLIVGVIRNGELNVMPTVDDPYRKSTPQDPSSTTSGQTLLSIAKGDKLLTIMPRVLRRKFTEDVSSGDVEECSDMMNMGMRFTMDTLHGSIWGDDGGLGGGAPDSTNSPFRREPSPSSPAGNFPRSLAADAEAKLKEEDFRSQKRKESKEHFLILDVPTELRDPGYTQYERDLSERTRLWNLSLIMRSILGVHQNSKITLISPLPLTKKFHLEWSRQGFPPLDFIQGSALNSHTVQNAISVDQIGSNSYKTQGVIIFTSSQGARSLGDAPLLGSFTSVRKVLSNKGRQLSYDTQVVMELSTFSACNLVGPFYDDLRLRRVSEEDFQMSIPFMTGKVFATDMLQPILIQTYGNSFVSEFFATLFNLTTSRRRQQSHTRQSTTHCKPPSEDDEYDMLDIACMGGVSGAFDSDPSPQAISSPADSLDNPWERRRLRREQSFTDRANPRLLSSHLLSANNAVKFRVYTNKRLKFTTFGEVFQHLLLSRGMLAFGIFRRFPMQLEGNPRYMITNPPPSAFLSVTDHIYCFIPWKPSAAEESASSDVEDGTNPTDSSDA